MVNKNIKILIKNISNYVLSFFVKSKKINTGKINFISTEIINKIFTNKEIETKYQNSREKIKTLGLPDFKGGINIGDQKAIFYFSSYFKPKNVLELGTHIGCSTVNIASGIDSEEEGKITTVDIVDVNSEQEKIWLKYDSPNSPKENLKKIGLSKKVEFIKSDTTKYLLKCKKKHDFIFIDAGHDFLNIYSDLSLSLNILDENGFLILHDFYDKNHYNLNDTKMNGPYLAIKKILKDNTDLSIFKIIELPWETKNKSKNTSLVIIYKKN